MCDIEWNKFSTTNTNRISYERGRCFTRAADFLPACDFFFFLENSERKSMISFLVRIVKRA